MWSGAKSQHATSESALEYCEVEQISLIYYGMIPKHRAHLAVGRAKADVPDIVLGKCRRYPLTHKLPVNVASTC